MTSGCFSAQCAPIQIYSIRQGKIFGDSEMPQKHEFQTYIEHETKDMIYYIMKGKALYIFINAYIIINEMRCYMQTTSLNF